MKAMLIEKLKRFWMHIREPMPLCNFKSYDEYWTKRIDDKRTSSLLYRYRYVADRLPDEGTVLDIGCGNGAFLKYLKSKKPKLQLLGFDISKRAIECLISEGINGKVVDADRDSLGKALEGMNVDYIVIMQVLEHLYHAEELIQEVRNLSPKCCFVAIPNLGYIVHRLRLGLAGKMPITGVIYHIREHIRFWTVKDFHYWADKMGFRVIEYSGQGGFPYLWKYVPSLLAGQLIFVLKPKNPLCGRS